MSISEIAAGITSAIKGGNTDIVLPSAKGFADTLTIGQIIKGRVLRHFGNDNYLVDFGGQKHVVDTSIALRTNDVIHGRVVGLGDKVQLKRIATPDGASQQTQGAGHSPTTQGDAVEGRGVKNTVDIFTRYNTALTEESRSIVMAATKAVDEPVLMLRMAIALSRLGLPQSPALLRAMYAAYTQHGTLGAVDLIGQQILQLGNAGSVNAQQIEAAVTGLADVIRQNVESVRGERNPANGTTLQPGEGVSDNSVSLESESNSKEAGFESNGTAFGSDMANMVRWVLNAQTEGAVSHRATTIQLLLGGKLLEVDVGLFDQKDTASEASVVRHRQITISVNLPQLGRVDITARMAGQHLKLNIKSDNELATEIMSQYMGELRSDVMTGGWQLDELAYETIHGTSHNAVVNSVVEHLITQDSLSRLV